ncbi:MAG: hypothetical protein IJW72_01230 [Alphaproteobacteria bacterium]|nr:hypothetical protein [Alphaproteobacteria bacterium]
MLQQQINRRTKSQNYTLSAPIGGLNVRDSLDTMPETDAIVMDNYLPQDTKIILRKGYVPYVKLGEKIETLLTYNSAEKKYFLACGGGKIWDISSSVEVTQLKDKLSISDWQYCQFKDRLIMVNGADKPQVFYIKDNEPVVEDAEFEGEGLLTNKLINVATIKQRLFFVEKGSLKAWYGDEVGNIQGTLIKFDLSTIMRQGGYLMSICSWTQDGGHGIDDLTAFISSEGEVAIYSGSDPSNIDDWNLRGVYRMSKPVGYHCAMQYQGDIVIISEDGYIPLSKALSLDKANASQIAFSDKIRGLVLNRTLHGKYKRGWQSIIYGRMGYALFNVPVAEQYEQHVVNVNSGAWCRFTNIRSHCWGLFQDRLYFGSDKSVFLFDEGYSDNTIPICGVVEQAYSNLGSANLKKIQLINPRTKASTRFALVVYTNMDFEERNLAYAENINHATLSKWNHLKWSSLKNPIGTKWATLKGKIQSQWIANSATGFKASVVFKTKTRGNLIEWYDTGFRYEQGNSIL